MKDYEYFLNNIDELSKSRLERINVIFEINKYNFSLEGFTLEETKCYSDNALILRNDKNFFPFEYNALNSKNDYKDYVRACEFYKKHFDEFENIHSLLVEKEIIMNGYYECIADKRLELDNIALSLGYKENRTNLLNKHSGRHPSEEYLYLVNVLNTVDKNNDINILIGIVKNNFKKLKALIKEDYHIELKYSVDKYNYDFDDAVGIVILNDESGLVEMLYGTNGIELYQSTYEKYFIDDAFFFEVYLKLILKCMLKIDKC